ncbi:hypothetical protein HWV62_4882 [Athelia sp. TMB]|nr:hypothetical protein HWV62_4882 [Athelia sp. TMB]
MVLSVVRMSQFVPSSSVPLSTADLFCIRETRNRVIELPSGRTTRHYDDWQSGDPPYVPADPYEYRPSEYPPTRDEYDMTDPRDPESWGRRYDDPNYKGVWDRRPAAVYPEPAWGAYESRIITAHEAWGPDVPRDRGGPSTDRDHIREGVEDHRDAEVAGWRKPVRKDGRKEGGKDDRRGGDPTTWRSDAGWQSRRADARAGDAESAGGRSVGSYTRPTTDDRSWEPAPTWQAQAQSGAHAQGSHKSSRNAQSGKNSKGKKRNQSSNSHPSATSKQQTRDWRNDDSTLNKYVLIRFLMRIDL